jgi:hypothetical protein
MASSVEHKHGYPVCLWSDARHCRAFRLVLLLLGYLRGFVILERSGTSALAYIGGPSETSVHRIVVQNFEQSDNSECCTNRNVRGPPPVTDCSPCLALPVAFH